MDEHFAPTVAPERRAAPGSRMAASLSDTDFDWGADDWRADLTAAGLGMEVGGLIGTFPSSSAQLPADATTESG